jgi:hypothetical protein
MSILGLLGGWYEGNTRSGFDRLGVDGYFAGAYVAVSKRAFALDGTVRREWRITTSSCRRCSDRVKRTSSMARLPPDRSVLPTVSAGPVGFAASPFIGFNYADSEIDDLPIDALSGYLPGQDTTKLGQVGAATVVPHRRRAQRPWSSLLQALRR